MKNRIIYLFGNAVINLSRYDPVIFSSMGPVESIVRALCSDYAIARLRGGHELTI